MKTKKSDGYIVIHGARENNLKGFDLSIPLNKLTVITGVSGSGKSSLAFDTIYAEGQRRYVETFSSYARQFLERMDRPRVDRIDGIPPAIAVDQTNPVRTSRSTVGTMTEINDYLKLLYARASRLYCGHCGKPVNRDNARSIFDKAAILFDKEKSPLALITFPVTVPANFSMGEVRAHLAAAGYDRTHSASANALEIIQDRVAIAPETRGRVIEDFEKALTHGQGRLTLYHLAADGTAHDPLKFSSGLHCPDCDIHYKDPTPNMFSFNSAIGACETCKGFGRVIGIDRSLVIPDPGKSLQQGAIRPFQSESYKECQDDLMRFCRKRGVPTATAWCDLDEKHKEWIFAGDGSWEEGKWYGVNGFFKWLEGRSYRMHVRVLLSRYRAYHECPSCQGARLKPEGLCWKIGPEKGLSLYDIARMPIDTALNFFTALDLPKSLKDATGSLVGEITTRLGYLDQVGLPYLTLDRQSRTLSGGEVQRINLTTALGTSLTNTLFVLDEPSIGLHSRDISRLIGVLHRLRDAGNTIIVVEHDPEVIAAADAIIDMGPGPGERGGNVVFQGTLQALVKNTRSLTGRYLTHKELVSSPRLAPPAEGPKRYLEILGATHHNLKNIDVHIPLGVVTCITGVSGSGKSTLIHDVCYRALRVIKRKPVEQPGEHREIRGHEHIDDVIMVDQSAIGKTTRSNPASYVGAFDPIRDLFSKQPLARRRGYTAGTFSFNSGNGRCPRCGGNGFEHVEMQFLSDVYLRCPDCNGTRYRPEILEVTLTMTGHSDAKSSITSPSDRAMRAVSIADVLNMTVAQARVFFDAYPGIVRLLSPLEKVGLSYMRLGQPLPTLSGGEAQRLKLAGYLAEKNSAAATGSLFLFDEPTTGLHFSDIAVLLKALSSLVDRGNTVVIIEHNLDVIAAADWIIDLGPEGGQAGGHIVYTGTPADIRRCGSHTGEALRRHDKYFVSAPKVAKSEKSSLEKDRVTTGASNAIIISKARQHNLRAIDVSIPRDKFTVITGVSGSGKSSLAFDVLFAEGQRRYLESLNAYARQFIAPASRPDIDALYGIAPTVAIEQRTSRGGRKSTVATVTETYHFLRLLFVTLGVRYCPDCMVPIKPQSLDSIAANLLSGKRGKTIALWAPLIVNRKGIYTEEARLAAKQGFADLRVDGVMVSTAAWPRLDRFIEHSIDAPMGTLRVNPDNELKLFEILRRGLDLGKGVVYVQTHGASVKGKPREEVFSTLNACPSCHRGFSELDPRLFSYNSKHGWCPHCFGTGIELAGFDEEQTGEEIWWNDWWEGEERPCSLCQGKRLNPEALAVLLKGKSISHYTALSVAQAEETFKNLQWEKGREEAVSRDIITELASRLSFLQRVGLDYMTLDRAAPTLSGGEAQRIRLAAQLGSNLRGVCYVLDEPTIGLHASDTRVLLDTLKSLQKKGNTVVVVEHDAMTINSADHVIDLGPGGGKRGGEIMAQGTPAAILRSKTSLTAQYLRAPRRHPFSPRRKPISGSDNFLRISGATLHNLKKLDVNIPLGCLVCVTGVSGSGKSTLVREVIYDNVKQLIGTIKTKKHMDTDGKKHLRGCSDIQGWAAFKGALEVDQRPIGKTPRSCPATYVGIFDDIRALFSKSPDAVIKGFSASRFSFNVAAGRCPVCEGQGIQTVAMSFLPAVTVVCDACDGARYSSETLSVSFKGKTIADVLRMNVDQAVDFFSFHTAIHARLKLMQDVGLGYLTLGQHSPTLSGGEAQRIKLVAELTEVKTSPDRIGPRDRGKHGSMLYVLDEPTIGLHMADVEKLVRMLHRLVDAGNTVMVIEHNLDVIAEADWVIDLGPGGGSSGGRILCQGAPEQVAKSRTSRTAAFLAEALAH